MSRQGGNGTGITLSVQETGSEERAENAKRELEGRVLCVCMCLCGFACVHMLICLCILVFTLIRLLHT